MDDLHDDEPEMLRDFRLEVPGAAVISQYMLGFTPDDPMTTVITGVRAALDLDPDCPVARVFEVTADAPPGRPLVRQMRYHDGKVARINVTMDADNQVHVAVASPPAGLTFRLPLDDLAKLCDLARQSADQGVVLAEQAQQALALAQSSNQLGARLAEENERLKAEISQLRGLLGNPTLSIYRPE